MKSLTIIIMLQYSPPSNIPTNTNSIIENNFNLVDAIISGLLEKTKVAGISVSVSESQEMIYSKAFGYSDVKNKIPIKPSSQIRAASVSKVITATALGKHN